MIVAVDDNDLAISVRNGLSNCFETLINALDALGNYDEKFTYEFIKSGLSREGQRSEMENTFHLNNGFFALFIC